ncbi:MAG: alpha/beta hydrolase [Deltaproteobacteria bacterium]|nr:alpha/beta hydrolase [Deltaproteobacteria bacterium]MDZ4341947.1 alpha/beta hydrolase [Candidatus Binatia bacterium]
MYGIITALAKRFPTETTLFKQSFDSLTIYSYLCLALASTALLCGCLMEEKIIFQPDAEIHQTPRNVGLAFDDIYFTTEDGVRLNGWFVPHPRAASTLLWFHGNAGNISHRVDNIKLLHDTVNVNIFIFDYRGYGRSDGMASEEGTYRDGAAAIEFLRQRYGVDQSKLIIFGRSLGAAVAAEMATRVQSLAVILETPFVSVRMMARDKFPFLPIGPLLKTRYDVVEKVRKIRSPLLVLHGDRDEIVPFSHGKQVFDAAPQPKWFYTIAGAGHNDTYLVGGNPYFAALRQHIERAEASSR